MSELANMRITRETLRIVSEASYRVDGVLSFYELSHPRKLPSWVIELDE